MCLVDHDLISDRVRQRGCWTDCGRFVRLWQTLDGGNFSGQAARPVAGDPEGVLLEVGANIGACTVELLMRTRARVVAFEPSAKNLFYLTRSISLLAQRDPSVAVRAGDAPKRPTADRHRAVAFCLPRSAPV